MKGLKRSVLAAAGVLAMAGGGAAGVSPASESPAGLIAAVYNPAAPVTLEKTQFVSAGAYCWYPAGWHGPGYYWCGYARRPGLGWGGAWGWRGWRWRDGYWNGGRYWGGPWRGGDWRGNGGWHDNGRRDGWRGGHDRGWHGGHPHADRGWHGGHDGRRR